MKKLNWLKTKDVDNETQVFIKPDFFDFTETKYPDGIPILGSLSQEELIFFLIKPKFISKIILLH